MKSNSYKTIAIYLAQGFLLFLTFGFIQSFLGKPIQSSINVLGLHIPTYIVLLSILVLISIINVIKSILRNKTKFFVIGIILGFLFISLTSNKLNDIQLKYTSRNLESICESIAKYQIKYNKLPANLEELKANYVETRTTNYYNLGPNGFQYELMEDSSYLINWQIGGATICDCYNCDFSFINMKYSHRLCFDSGNTEKLKSE